MKTSYKLLKFVFMASVVDFWEVVNLYSQILSGVQALSGFHAYYAPFDSKPTIKFV